MSAAGADEALSAAPPGVTGDWGNTSEAFHAFMFSFAEFGRFDEHCQRGCFTGGRDAHPDIEAGFQIRIGHAQRAQGCVDSVDLALDLAQPPIGETFEQGRAVDVIAACDSNAASYQAAACDEQFLHPADRLADHRPCLQLAECGEAGEHGGVGFCSSSDGFRKASCP